MKMSLLSRLHTYGAYYIGGAVLLLLGAPLYQLLVLLPQGYTSTVGHDQSGPYVWIGHHVLQFLGYRVLLLLAFMLLFSLPFTLFRIIVVQELFGLEEELEGEEQAQQEEKTEEGSKTDAGELPADAWRGQGCAVIAAWVGALGIVCTLLGILASSIYLAIVETQGTVVGGWSVLFAIVINTVGGGLLALSCLSFGFVIARRGRNLWPGVWVVFGYAAIALALLFSASAVDVATHADAAGAQGVTVFSPTFPAIIVFALWALWFGVMLVRLRPAEP